MKAILVAVALLRTVSTEASLTRSANTWRFVRGLPAADFSDVAFKFGFDDEKDAVIFRGRNLFGSLLRAT